MPVGVEVNTRTAPGARGVDVDISTLFVAGKTVTGSVTEPVVLRSIKDFEDEYGARAAGNQTFYDVVDTAFREGVSRIIAGGFTTAGTYTAGLAVLNDKTLGPGQLIVTDAAYGDPSYQAILNHCLANNRFALLDVALADDTVAELDAKGDIVVACDNPEYGMLVGPWMEIPAPAGVVGGSARQVPASAVVAGLIRADALGNPNRAAAGRWFPVQYATGPILTINDSDVNALLDVGVNVFTTKYDVLQLYGFQTPVEQDANTPFWQANCSRARMYLVAQAQRIGENYMFKPIDGRGLLAQALKSELDALCGSLYSADGLYGETPADAYATNVSASLNTSEVVAQGELHGQLEVRLTLHNKRTIIELVSVPIGGNVGA